MDLGLQGKVAIVTGASKGIGLQTAQTLAQEGANVVICARREERLQTAVEKIKEATGKEVHYVVCDVTDDEAVKNVVAKTVERFDGIDILVNNAGTSAANPFMTVDDDLWQGDLDLKLFGAIRFIKAAFPYLQAADQGAIVNVTAVGGRTPGAASFPTSVSRAAGQALTKGLSKELGPDNIRVNTVCMGLIRSEQIEKRWQKEAPDKTWEEFSQSFTDIPLGRIGQTQEAANTITFLVSQAASYLTGVAINIDGGSAAVL